MSYELLIANKETGEIWDVSTIVPGTVQYTTERMGTPGKLTFSVMEGVEFNEGDVVRFSVDAKLIFYGFVFTKSTDRWGVTQVTCYDRLRYLKANNTYAFYALKAGDIVKQIAEDLLIDVGEIEDTGYKLPSLVVSDQLCIDIIQAAISQTLLNTGILYTLYDNGTGLSLKSSAEWFSEVVLGDKSYITDYTYTSDIDTNVYNSVKLVQPNEETGRNEVVVVQDSANIEKWGLLQLYQSIDNGLNAAQMAERAKETLNYYNRVRRTVSLSAIGVDGLRAGMMVRVLLPKVQSWCLIESCTHTYSESEHTMELEVYDLT